MVGVRVPSPFILASRVRRAQTRSLRGWVDSAEPTLRLDPGDAAKAIDGFHRWFKRGFRPFRAQLTGSVRSKGGFTPAQESMSQWAGRRDSPSGRALGTAPPWLVDAALQLRL